MIQNLALLLAATVLVGAFYELRHQRRSAEHWRDEAEMANSVRTDLAWKLERMEHLRRKARA